MGLSLETAARFNFNHAFCKSGLGIGGEHNDIKRCHMLSSPVAFPIQAKHISIAKVLWATTAHSPAHSHIAPNATQAGQILV